MRDNIQPEKQKRPIPRPGRPRVSEQRKNRTLRATEQEWEKIKEFAHTLKQSKK